MAQTLYTPDGKSHALIRDDDFTNLIEQYAGADAARQVRELQEEVEYLASFLDEELF